MIVSVRYLKLFPEEKKKRKKKPQYVVRNTKDLFAINCARNARVQPRSTSAERRGVLSAVTH